MEELITQYRWQTPYLTREIAETLKHHTHQEDKHSSPQPATAPHRTPLTISLGGKKRSAHGDQTRSHMSPQYVTTPALGKRHRKRQPSMQPKSHLLWTKSNQAWQGKPKVGAGGNAAGSSGSVGERVWVELSGTLKGLPAGAGNQEED